MILRYLKILSENNEIKNIDFQKEFIDAGVAAKKGVTEDDVDTKELEIGIEVEMEHTLNSNIARKIALDHLAELPDYYTRLRKMENDAFKELNKK